MKERLGGAVWGLVETEGLELVFFSGTVNFELVFVRS